MFAAIIHRAQAAVDTAIDGLVNRAIIAVPFLIAAGFATAALSLRITREYGAETSNLILAGGFAVVGLLCFALVGRSAQIVNEDGETVEQSTEQAADQQNSPQTPQIDAADRELMMAALSSAAPLALPGLIKLVLRNLPLVIAIISALFVLTRSTEEAPASSEASTA